MQDLVDGGRIYVNGVQGTSSDNGIQIHGNVVNGQIDRSHTSFNQALYTDVSEHVRLEENVTERRL